MTLRGAALWLVAGLISLAVHALLSWRVGVELAPAPLAVPESRVIQLLEEVVSEPEVVEMLKFEQPLQAPPPEILVPTRTSLVVPDIPATALRASRGGGPVVSGPGPGSLLPGPASELVGTGLGEGSDRFARYVEDLREAGLDVVFVVDATGSMGWAIDEVKRLVKDSDSFVVGQVLGHASEAQEAAPVRRDPRGQLVQVFVIRLFALEGWLMLAG